MACAGSRNHSFPLPCHENSAKNTTLTTTFNLRPFSYFPLQIFNIQVLENWQIVFKTFYGSAGTVKRVAVGFEHVLSEDGVELFRDVVLLVVERRPAQSQHHVRVSLAVHVGRVQVYCLRHG